MAETKIPADHINSWLTKTLIHNLHIECSAASQVVIKAGSSVGADDGSVVMEAGADITVDITNSGANGLDTGSEAANTWYYIYMIWNPSTETVAGLLSASSTAPTLPSGYTKKRLVGAVRNDSSSNFLQFFQRGKEVKGGFGNIVSGWASTTPTTLSLSASVPEKAVGCVVHFQVWRYANQGINYQNIRVLDDTGTIILATLATEDYDQTKAHADVSDTKTILRNRTIKAYTAYAPSSKGAAIIDIRGFTLDI